MDKIKNISLISFFKKTWWWNILIDVLIIFIAFYLFVSFLNGNKEIRNVYSLMALLAAGGMHLLYLSIIFLLHAFKKRTLISILLLLHITILSICIYVIFVQFSLFIFIA